MIMKVLKFIGQILASFVYTCLFTGIMFLVITIPLAFVISLPWWGILLFIFIGGGILEGIIQLLGTMGVIPYIWINRKNIVATGLAILLLLFNVGTNIYKLWAILYDHGTWAIVFGIVATVMLLQFIYVAIVGIIMGYNSDEI